MLRKELVLALTLSIAIVLAGCSGEQVETSPLIGSDAPDFMLDNALGGQTSLAEYQGTPVLLFFHMAVG